MVQQANGPLARLKEIFSSPSVSVACLLVAVVAKITLLLIFFTFNRDMLLQGLAAQNVANGHGITLALVHPPDLSTVVYEPLAGWPPLYSLLISFFYIIFNKNLIAACMVVAIGCFVGFLLLLRRLLLLLGFSSFLINLLILFNGFNITDYLQRSLPTDMPAMLCCLWACYMAIRFINNKKPAKYGILMGIVNALPALFRYMYVGVMPVIPLVLIWNGWYKKDKRILRGGFYLLTVAFLLTGSMLLFQHFYTGNSTYTRPVEQGFFFSNLQYTNPFIFSVLSNPDFINMQLSLHTGISYSGWVRIETMIAFLPMILLLYVFVKYCVTTKVMADTPMKIFLLLGGWLSVFIWLTLCYVSVRNSAHYTTAPKFDWVYISEARYFAFVLVTLQVVFVWWLFRTKLTKAKRLLQWLFLLFISVEISHGAYYIAKYFKDPSQHVPLLAEPQLKSDIVKIVEQYKKEGITPVFSSFSQQYCGEAYFAGADILYRPEELNSEVLATTKPVVVILLLDINDSIYLGNFLARKGVNKIHQAGKFYFFTYYIVADAHQQQ